VEQHEAAGSIGVLRRSRLEARLAEERSLLIAGVAGNRHCSAEELGIGLPIHLARRPHFRQHRAWYIEQAQQLVIPLERVDVEQQRAAGVTPLRDAEAA